MFDPSTIRPRNRKVFEGVASRREMYALFNRHSEAPFDEFRMSGRRHVGEWFEVSQAEYDHMFNILLPLFIRGDMFAMGERLAESVTSIFLSLRIDGRLRWFHGHCDLADSGSPDRLRATIIERESRPVRAMARQEKLDHIWSTTGAGFRAYADNRFPGGLRGRPIVLVYTAAQARIWKLLDKLTDDEIAAKLPVQFRRPDETVTA